MDGWKGVAKDIADGVVITADTLEDLAGKLGIDAAGLARTMKDWNEDVAAGTDRLAARTAGTDQRPFYAYKNTSYNLGALGGLKITTDCEVVDVNGKVIEGLYAAGLNAGGWVGRTIQAAAPRSSAPATSDARPGSGGEALSVIANMILSSDRQG